MPREQGLGSREQAGMYQAQSPMGGCDYPKKKTHRVWPKAIAVRKKPVAAGKGGKNKWVALSKL